MSAVVIQADRERAAEFFRSDACLLSVKMTLGYDPSALLQAFASHREAHTAGLREALDGAVASLEWWKRNEPASFGNIEHARLECALAALAEHGK